MSRAVRSELRKLTTTRLWWGMLLGALALAALGVVSQIATNGLPRVNAPPLTDPATQRAILSSAAGAYIFSVVVGIILITTEFRHFTSRPTFLAEPRRGVVVLAKLVASLGVGLLYGVAAVAVAVAIAVPWLAAKQVHLDWTGSGLVVVVVGAVFAVAVYAVVGLGVGVLLRNQVAAVLSTLAYLLVVEPLVGVVPVIKEAYRFLPGAAARALTGARSPDTTLLTNWQGGLVLLGWGLLFAVLGWLVMLRRDVP